MMFTIFLFEPTLEFLLNCETVAVIISVLAIPL